MFRKEYPGKKQIRRIGLAAGFLAAAAVFAGGRMGTAADEGGEPETQLTAVLFDPVSESYGIWAGAGAEKLLSDTGIRLEFYSNGSGKSQQLYQYMAAGTLPDILEIESGQIRILKDTQLLLNLDEYEEVLSPLLQNEAYREALGDCRRSFGGEEALYLLPVEVGERGENDFEWMPLLQWKPYAQAGCPEVETLEDYLDVVEEMLRYKSMTPLGGQVYGFSLSGGQDPYTAEEVSSLSYLYGTDTGLASGLIEVNAETGELSCVTDEDSFYRRALRFYFEANRRGLLDPDSRTQTYENLMHKYDKGQILFCIHPYLVSDYNADQEQKGYGFNDYVPIVASDMRIYQEPDNPGGNGWYFAVNANCRKPEAACSFLNWLYDPENIAYLYSSPGDLKPFQDLGLSREEAGVGSPALMYRRAGEGDSYTEEETIGQYLTARGMAVTGSTAANRMPELSTSMRNQCAAIGQVIRDLSWDMIYAETEDEFDGLWEQMVRECGELGIRGVEAYCREAWAEAQK